MTMKQLVEEYNQFIEDDECKLRIKEQPRLLIVSCLERILHKNCILALGRGGQKGNGAADQLLDPSYILDRLGRQIRPGPGSGRGTLPALDGLVDRLHPGRQGNRPSAGRRGCAGPDQAGLRDHRGLEGTDRQRAFLGGPAGPSH